MNFIDTTDNTDIKLTILTWVLYMFSFMFPKLSDFALFFAILASVSTIAVNYIKYKDIKRTFKKNKK
jgi:uncharacterized membrane protein